MKHKKLGFGLMRLPLLDPSDPSDIDTAEMARMVDAFLDGGFSYFDTAYAYGNSERAMCETLVKRHPRDSYAIATKLPVMMLQSKEHQEQIFDEQLKNCGVDYFDYYLLHDLSRSFYPLAEQMGSFAFIAKKKAEGKIRNIGFSFHDSADVLEQILTEHPEVDFVQLQINYLDWDNASIQSKKCYEVATNHGKPIVVMEPVKGGTLANVSAEAEKLLTSHRPDLSVASWAVRFAASLDNVMVVLSGMSNMAQMQDNISYMRGFEPLSIDENEIIQQAIACINASIAIACTACCYCVSSCSQNIAIPEYFALFNAEQQDIHKGASVQLDYFASLIQSHGKPSDCIACKKCEVACPQHLHVADSMKTVADEMEVALAKMMESMMGD